MKKVVRLTESDLARIVKRVINEQEEKDNGFFGDLSKIIKRVSGDAKKLANDEPINPEGGESAIKNDFALASNINSLAEKISVMILKYGSIKRKINFLLRRDTYGYEKENLLDMFVKESNIIYRKFFRLEKLINLFNNRGMALYKSKLSDYGLEITKLLDDIEKFYEKLYELRELTDDNTILEMFDEAENNLNTFVDLLYEIPD
jgi:hypothetical protein